VQKTVFWVKKNGVDYPDSATEMDLQPRKGSGNPNRQVITINYVATAEAGDYVQVFWAGDSTELKIESLPAGTNPVYPAVPSIILTAVQVMYTQVGPQGIQGEVGPAGATGDDAIVVQSEAPVNTDILWLDTDETLDIPVPSGGTTGQVLSKASASEFDTTWADPSALVLLNSTNFTAQSTVTINNVFSSNYDTYKVVWSFTQNTATSDASWTLVNGSTAAASNWGWNTLLIYQAGTASYSSNASFNGSTSFTHNINSGGQASMSLEISNPFLTQRTFGRYEGHTTSSGYGVNATLRTMSVLFNNTSYEGFRITATAGTMTGRIRIYGMRS
jgi:hypothetical protein